MKKSTAKNLRIGLFSSVSFMILLNMAIFFWDFYAGEYTRGFGVLEPYHGIGMFFVFMISYLSSLIVVSAIIRTDRFGMGLFVWLPYAVAGLFVEAYFELILNPVLKGYWAIVGWCVFGLLTGFSADLTYYLLNRKLRVARRWAAGATGVVMSLVYYLTTLVAISTFYAGSTWGSFTAPGTFQGVSYFMVPWMLVHAFFGGYSAFAFYQLGVLEVEVEKDKREAERD